MCFLTFAFALRSHVACPDQLRFTLLACCTRVTCILYWEKRLRTTTPAVALWDTLLQGAATDVVTKHAITCCTKWSVGDRFTTNYTEWSFEYDHIFATSKLVASGAHLIPYTYPGTAKRCVDAACTGEDPPANVTALHQGSWHRGWVVDFSWVGLE